MEYKGYAAGPISFDSDEGVFSGTVAGLRAVLHFQGTTADELAQAFRDTVDDYIDWCAKRGKEPERPFKGHILIRTAPERTARRRCGPLKRASA